MDKNKKIASDKQVLRKVASLLLFSILMFPNAIQFSHAFEAHEHAPCTEKSTHIHQAIPNCDICDFHFVPFSYKIQVYPEFFDPNVPEKVEKHFSTLLYHPFKKTNTQLRAPPYFLV